LVGDDVWFAGHIGVLPIFISAKPATIVVAAGLARPTFYFLRLMSRVRPTGMSGMQRGFLLPEREKETHVF
jgi:hypothetical protein